jgi:hypothetical protein
MGGGQFIFKIFRILDRSAVSETGTAFDFFKQTEELTLQFYTMNHNNMEPRRLKDALLLNQPGQHAVTIARSQIRW